MEFQAELSWHGFLRYFCLKAVWRSIAGFFYLAVQEFFRPVKPTQCFSPFPRQLYSVALTRRFYNQFILKIVPWKIVFLFQKMREPRILPHSGFRPYIRCFARSVTRRGQCVHPFWFRSKYVRYIRTLTKETKGHQKLGRSALVCTYHSHQFGLLSSLGKTADYWCADQEYSGGQKQRCTRLDFMKTKPRKVSSLIWIRNDPYW